MITEGLRQAEGWLPLAIFPLLSYSGEQLCAVSVKLRHAGEPSEAEQQGLACLLMTYTKQLQGSPPPASFRNVLASLVDWRILEAI